MIDTVERREDGVVRRPDLLAALTALARDVQDSRLPLDLPGVERHRELRERLAGRLTTHLVPRLRHAATPAVVVVGGSTGAGKSTLVNTLVGREVSPAGLRRPTTRQPVLVVHPRDADAFHDHPLTAWAEVVSDDGVPVGLALLDAPDLDSIHGGNRHLAEQLLQAADLWVFVTTATRYGDALPWNILTAAQDRGLATAILLNRVPEDVLHPVRADLLLRLDSLGLGSAPLFVVADAGPRTGTLPPGWLQEVADWFTLVATRRQAPGIVQRTLRGGWPALRAEVLDLADAVAAQLAAADRLRSLAAVAVAPVAQRLVATLESGAATDGAPAARWSALAGEPLARPRRGRRARAREDVARVLGQDTLAALTPLVAQAVQEAADAVHAAWAGEPGAAGLPEPVADRAAAQRVVQEWSRSVHARAAGLDAQGALGADGLAGLLQAAAAGLTGAADAVAELVGSPAVVAEVRADLTAAAAGEVERVGSRCARTVDDLQLRPGVVAGLRHHAEELEGLT